MNNQIKQLLEKWSASINEKKYRETAQCYEPLTCKPKYETHAGVIKRAARRWRGGIMILLHSPSMTGGEFLLRAPNGAAEL